MVEPLIWHGVPGKQIDMLSRLVSRIREAMSELGGLNSRSGEEEDGGRW